MASVIVEVQCFYDNNKKFIIKELALVQLDEMHQNVFLFKAPYHILCVDDRNTVRYLEQNFHKIRWSDGNVDYDELESILKTFTKRCENIFTKGLEKKLFLEEILERKVIDLNEVMNNGREWKEFCGEREPVCTNHRGEVRECALKNATKLRDWLQSRVETRLQQVLGRVDSRGNPWRRW